MDQPECFAGVANELLRLPECNPLDSPQAPVRVHRQIHSRRSSGTLVVGFRVPCQFPGEVVILGGIGIADHPADLLAMLVAVSCDGCPGLIGVQLGELAAAAQKNPGFGRG